MTGTGDWVSDGRKWARPPAYWPVAPFGIDWGNALYSLCMFPGCRFKPIDQAEGAYLFDVVDETDVALRDTFRVAVWNNALRHLSDEGLINGVSRATEREWQVSRRHVMMGGKPDDPMNQVLGWQLSDGTWQVDELPPATNEPYDERSLIKFDNLPGPSVQVSDAGWQHYREVLSSELRVPDRYKERINKLLGAEQYDSAARLATIFLEERLREVVQPATVAGRRAVERLVKDLRDPTGQQWILPANLGLDMHTAFKWLRNELAHNSRVMSADEGRSVITRVMGLIEDVDAVAERGISSSHSDGMGLGRQIATEGNAESS